MPICVHIVYNWCHVTELSTYNRDCVTTKPETFPLSPFTKIICLLLV